MLNALFPGESPTNLLQPGRKLIPKYTLLPRFGHNPVPNVDEPWVAAAFTPPQERTPELKEAIQLSDLLVDEFLAADLYVFGVPMFNFSVPSTFKAYIDQIGRIGRNFAVDEQGFKGLVEGNKKVLVITACGGSFQPGTPIASYDFQEPYLRSILGFIGITEIKLIHADNLSSTREQSLANARESVQAMWTDW